MLSNAVSKLMATYVMENTLKGSLMQNKYKEKTTYVIENDKTHGLLCHRKYVYGLVLENGGGGRSMINKNND